MSRLTMTLSPFTKRLGLVIAALNLFVIAMAVLWLRHSLDQDRSEAITVVDNLAQELQASLIGTIRHIDLAMLTVGDEYRRQSAAPAFDERAFNELLARQQGHLAMIESLRVTDAAGNVRFGLGADRHTNLADREFFIKARDDVDAGLVIAKPVFARISKKWVIVFARRLEAADGRFAGAVYINVALERLSREFEALHMGASGSASLRDGDLGLILRVPEIQSADKTMGSRTVSEALRQQVKAGHHAGTYMAASGFDSVNRASAFRRLDPYPLYVVIGIAEDDYLATWHQQAAIGAAEVLLFMLVTLSSGWLLVRGWQRQQGTAAELARSERELKTIIDTEPECVNLVDADCRLLRMNAAGLRMLEADAESQLLGQDVTALIDPEHREAFRALTQRVFAGESGTLEFAVIGLKGRRVWFDTHAAPLRDATGKVVAALGVTRDVTERRRLREELEWRVVERTAQLETANKELEEFSYSMSHDMRTPLRAINGYSAILLEEHQEHLDAEGRRLLTALAANADRMGRLIDDILRFLGMARRKLKPAVFDVAALAAETLAALKAQRPGRAVRLELRTLPQAWGDPEMIGQLLRELLANALKFSVGEGEATVEIGGHEEGDAAVFYVRDHGVGFDMRYADKLFKVFERVHAPGDFEGTGIGLAIVKRIVERHGGRVWADAAVDQGACFYFSLPRPPGWHATQQQAA